MKKIIFSMLFFGIATFVMAQDKGMHFEHNTSWQKVLAQAKAENKYIFVDCFTTWCGPCKMMSSTIFPMEEVGSFYNKNFINIKIQLDTTKNDNEEVKSWFSAGKEISTKYQVQAYPTYLMFNPNGEIVHRAVGSSDAAAFLAKGADAMNPDKQYYTLKREYDAGKKGDAFLYKVAKAAADAYDMQFAKKVTDEYLATQTDLYTKENLELLQIFTRTSKDQGFTIMLNNPEKVDAVLGKGVSESVVQRIILQEEVFPELFQNGATKPDWAAIEKTVKEKYPAQANQAILYSKVVYAQQMKNWNDFGPAVVAYMKSYGDNASPDEMNNFAWTIFENCNDMACVESALDWSRQSFANNNTPGFIDTYANLLYKMGKKNEAIEWETKAKEFAIKSGEDPKGYETVIDKMQKGEKTW